MLIIFPTFEQEVILHYSNNYQPFNCDFEDFAGGNVSKGYLLIKGGTDWNNYNKQLNRVSTHLLQVRRKWFTPYKLPFNK